MLGEELGEGDLELVRENLARVKTRIHGAGGDPGQISIVAVTKGFGLAAVRCALALGISEVGESYAGELAGKARRLAELEPAAAPSWHFLGAVQRNKVGRLASVVRRFEALDRLVEGERIAALAPGTSVLVEVDFTGRPARGGVAPDQVGPLVAGLRRLALQVDGLMTVAPEDRAAARAAFAGLGALAGDLGLAEVSMGMSGDLELAVAAGTTCLRLGRALFGPRPAAAAQGPAARPDEVPE